MSHTAHKYAGKRIAEILQEKKASIKQAGLDPGSPSWDEILYLTWEELEDRKNQGKPGYRTIHKLLTDGRFDK